ncbi:RagB/SusD family nutrient uptake outer membrane protein [Bacteroides sp. UBA939]|uniref:RagB/SusD family nutrient uptake outer membrane protein n=1 Tax=Bacteroides sp. UBA939 TaxID=1946092 RepID=UPI0025C211E0|nr:RagB/SusD family nutrient uptake outer membrane protein [Bacteroides sp. UBA939]
MKKFIKYCLLITISAVLSGCSEDFLDRVPGDALSPATFWQTEADAYLALTGCYRQLHSPYRIEEMWYWDCTSDNQYSFHIHENYKRIANGTMDASYTQVYNYFTFLDIRTFNEYLKMEKNIKFSDDDAEKPEKRKQYRAEVRVLRAMKYFWKVMCYGDFPFTTTEVFESIEESLIPRTSKNEILDFIKTELNDCINALPKTEETGRMTKGGAQAFLTRVYLLTGDYTNAASTAKKIIDEGTYSMPNLTYEESFLKANQYNSEVIFTTEHNLSGKYGMWFGAYLPNGYGGWSSIVPTHSLVEAYEMKSGLTTAEDSTFDPTNPYVNRDPRLRASIVYPGQVWATYTEGFPSVVPGSDDYALDANNATHTGYNFKKFYSDLSEYPNVWDAERNFPVLRYAEVLLSYAEAKIELNQIDASVYEYINEVRTRAGMPNVDQTRYATQEKLRELVRRERQVEFAYEGLRRWDIIRWGIAKDVLSKPVVRVEGELLETKNAEGDFNVNITGTTVEETRTFTVGKNEVLPVPQSVIDANPNITQNPNY